MKLNLLFNGTDIRPDYVNIDHSPVLPTNQAFSGKKTVGSISNLDWICKEGEAEEILALDCLSSFPFAEMVPVLNHWVSKLKPEGKIFVGGFDIYEISKGISFGTVNVAQANELLFTNSKGTTDIQFILSVFNEMGLSIIKKTLSNYKYIIGAQK